MVQPDRPQMTKWRMSFAYWITEGTDSHSLQIATQEAYLITEEFPFHTICTGKDFNVIHYTILRTEMKISMRLSPVKIMIYQKLENLRYFSYLGTT
jgi:hypothetical protein